MLHSYVLFMTKYAVLTPPLSDWGTAIAPSRRRVFWVASCVYLGRCFQVFTPVWACKINILFRALRRFGGRFSSSSLHLFFLVCGMGRDNCAKRSFIRYNPFFLTPGKVGKLASFYFISFQALPFLTTRYQEEGRRMHPSVKRSIASTPLWVSFQNK